MAQSLIRRDGFTTIEMVVTILVSSILAIGIVDFIGNTVQGLDSSANRNQLSTAGRTAIDRLAMEIHNALPNSMRTTTATAGGDQCVEFIPVRATTSYINPSFRGMGSLAFDVVDLNPSQQGVNGGYAVIYPNRRNRVYAGDNGPATGWPNFLNNRPIQAIDTITDSAAADQSTITLVTTHRFNRRSPSRRFFVVDDPVSYCVVADKLYRYTNYGFFFSQVTQEEEAGVCELALDQTCLPNYAAAPDKVLITDSIDNTGLTAFSVESQTLTRNALLAIELNLAADGDIVRLNHDVLTRSVP
jgi:MSHA biogenesis protein MshO